MSFLLAANWKMHKGPKETQAFFKELSEKKLPSSVSFAFFVPSVNAFTTSEALNNTPHQWGPQNIYPADQGAFTGETSPLVMADLGAELALVGHSERRQHFHESNEDTHKKIRACWQKGLTPMLCVGENLEQRKQGQTLKVIEQQLLTAFGSDDQPEQTLHIAYEPVWAIGTGEVASPDQVAEVHAFLHEFLKTHRPQATASRLLYGGSVKAQNSAELSQVPHVQGFLVGGASLEVDSFCDIANQLVQ